MHLSLNNKQVLGFVTTYVFPKMRTTLCKNNKEKLKSIQIKLAFQRNTFVYSTNAVICPIKAKPQENIPAFSVNTISNLLFK